MSVTVFAVMAAMGCGRTTGERRLYHPTVVISLVRQQSVATVDDLQPRADSQLARTHRRNDDADFAERSPRLDGASMVTSGKLVTNYADVPSVLRMSDGTLAAHWTKVPTQEGKGPICCSRSRRTTVGPGLRRCLLIMTGRRRSTLSQRSSNFRPRDLASFGLTPAPTTSTRPTTSASGTRPLTPVGSRRPTSRSTVASASAVRRARSSQRTACSQRIGTAVMTRCATSTRRDLRAARGPKANPCTTTAG